MPTTMFNSCANTTNLLLSVGKALAITAILGKQSCSFSLDMS